MIDFSLYAMYALLIITALLALGFSAYFMARNFAAAKGTFLGIAVIVVIFVICYSVSAGQANKEYDVTVTVSKFIGGSLLSFYIMLIGAFLLIVGTEVYNLIKK